MGVLFMLKRIKTMVFELASTAFWQPKCPLLVASP